MVLRQRRAKRMLNVLRAARQQSVRTGPMVASKTKKARPSGRSEGSALAHVVDDSFAQLVEKPSPFKIHTMEESDLNRKDDGGSFGVGDAVVHAKVIGQGGGK
jgi:hypothetical protein